MDSGEAEIGRAVLKMLLVPEPVQQAVDAYFEGLLEIPSTTLGDTLMLAEQLAPVRSEEHTSELQSLMRISYAVFCLKKKNKLKTTKANAKHMRYIYRIY